MNTIDDMEPCLVRITCHDGDDKYYRRSAEGFAFDCAGVPMVAHLYPIADNHEIWRVTEPETGCCITLADAANRELAVRLARAAVEAKGVAETRRIIDRMRGVVP